MKDVHPKYGNRVTRVMTEYAKRKLGYEGEYK